MATRSRIGMVHDDGTVSSIYCHWDGYPANNGKILFNHYKEKDKVEKLIALGDISSLEKEVDIPEGKMHTYDNPIENITVAYCRDVGEKKNEPRIDESVDIWKKSKLEEYGYLFKDNKWFVVDCHKKYRKIIEITEEYLQKCE